MFFKPFEALVEASDDDDETVAVAEDVIATSILPAFERLLDFFNTTYLPAAKVATPPPQQAVRPSPLADVVHCAVYPPTRHGLASLARSCPMESPCTSNASSSTQAPT